MAATKDSPIFPETVHQGSPLEPIDSEPCFHCISHDFSEYQNSVLSASYANLITLINLEWHD